MKILLILLFISINGYASDWRDLEVLQTYKLKQDFQLPQKERSGSLLDFSKEEELVLKEKMALSGIGVMLFIFKYVPCPGQEMETGMEIIPVQGTDPMIEIGAQLEAGCEFNVYVEIRDLFTKSFLE